MRFAAQAKEYQQLQAQIDEVDVKLKAWYHADPPWIIN